MRMTLSTWNKASWPRVWQSKDFTIQKGPDGKLLEVTVHATRHLWQFKTVKEFCDEFSKRARYMVGEVEGVMALDKVKTNHNGAKNGDKWGTREVVKTASRKRRRAESKKETAEQEKESA